MTPRATDRRTCRAAAAAGHPPTRSAALRQLSQVRLDRATRRRPADCAAQCAAEIGLVSSLKLSLSGPWARPGLDARRPAPGTERLRGTGLVRDSNAVGSLQARLTQATLL